MAKTTNTKDNLNTDEEIIASATFHNIRNLRLPLLIIIAFGILFLLALGPLRGKVLNVLYGEHLTAYFKESIDKESNYFYHWEWGRADKEIQKNGAYYRYHESLGEISIDSFKHIAQNKGLDKSYHEYPIRNGYPSIFRIIVFWIFVLGLAYLTYKLAAMTNRTNELVKTSQRIIAKTGLFRQTTFEIKNSQVESISVHQGLLGRFLNYGTITLCGTGASKIRIPFVVKPFDFRKQLADQ